MAHLGMPHHSITLLPVSSAALKDQVFVPCTLAGHMLHPRIPVHTQQHPLLRPGTPLSQREGKRRSSHKLEPSPSAEVPSARLGTRMSRAQLSDSGVYSASVVIVGAGSAVHVHTTASAHGPGVAAAPLDFLASPCCAAQRLVRTKQRSGSDHRMGAGRQRGAHAHHNRDAACLPSGVIFLARVRVRGDGTRVRPQVHTFVGV